MDDLTETADLDGALSEGISSVLRLPEARGRRLPRSSPDFTAEIVRPLGETDVDNLLAPPPPGIGFALKEIRSQHHQIARLLCTSKNAVEVSLITGYTPMYIRLLQEDPAFRELLAHYSSEVEAVAVDALERLKTLGLAAVEELQKRLEDDPGAIPRRELAEMADLGLVKTGIAAAAGRGASGNGGGISLNVQFVAPGTSSAFPTPPSRPVIDGEILDPAERLR